MTPKGQPTIALAWIGLDGTGALRVVEQPDLNTVFAELFQAHERVVLRFLFSALRSMADAEDLAQDVFIELHAALRARTEIRTPRTWLLHVAKRRAVDVLRRRATRRRFALAAEASQPGATTRGRGESGEAGDGHALVLAPAAPPQTPHDQLVATARREALKRALLESSALHRACVLLRWRGLTYREIQAQLGLTSIRRVTTLLAQVRERVGRDGRG